MTLPSRQSLLAHYDECESVDDVVCDQGQVSYDTCSGVELIPDEGGSFFVAVNTYDEDHVGIFEIQID